MARDDTRTNGSLTLKRASMPRDGAIDFDDLHGRLSALRVACETCG
jgi:hypothetical protein